MTFGKRSVRFALIALYAGAVWVRLGNLGASEYPYFKGESGTNFRYAREIADTGRLMPTDALGSQPEGFSPSRVRPTGVEFLTGFVYRLVQPFSDVPQRRFAAVFTVLFSSLGVLTLFAMGRMLWDCRAAGVFAAFLAAFHPSLAALTDGREFLHAQYAFVLVSLHLALIIRSASRPSLPGALFAGAVSFVLLGSWGGAGLYVAAATVATLAHPGIPFHARRAIGASQISALVLAVIALPHLRSGTTGLFGPVTYWLSRIRFIVGKPLDPSQLSDAVRLAWMPDHAPPAPLAILALFLPLAILAVPAVASLREWSKARPVPLRAPFAALAIGCGAYLLDSRAVLAASVVTFPFVAGAFRGFSSHVRSRVVPALLSVALVVAGLVPDRSWPDPVSRATARFGAVGASSAGFTWASIGNADRELVRFLITRTSTRGDVILAPPAVSSLVAGFAGRATVVAPGVYTNEMSAKVVRNLAAFYGGEADLYERCRTLGATYVLYSIDIFLDGSVYSPRYLSNASQAEGETIAYRMHFAPETLRRFQLVYQNDIYRLFRVTADPQPVFLTDHPPVYHENVFRAFGNDIESFYGGIVDVLSTYQIAVDAQSLGDEEGAMRRFLYCLDIAPRFTAARNGLGDSLLRSGRPADAYAAYRRVLQYAPDDKHSLYFGALSLAYLGRRGEALALLEVLLSATAEAEPRAEALELKSAIERDGRIEMPRVAPGSSSD